MPVKVKYIPDHKGMAEFMLSEQARRPCVEVAAKIVADLAVTVTRSSGAGEHLADSFKVNAESAPVTMGESPRAGAEVYSEDPAAAPEEFGGKRNKAQHWLLKAGLKYHVPFGGKQL